jgi:hypothetical protein
MKRNCAFSFSSRNYRLLDDNVCLEVGFSDTNSIISIGSYSEFQPFILGLALGYFKLSLEECIEFTICGLKTNIVHGLFSFTTLKTLDKA